MIEKAWKETDSRTELRNTVLKCQEYQGLNDQDLKQGIEQLDILLEHLLPLAAEHDKNQCNTSEDGDSWNWQTKLMRCRYVLGVD